MHKRAYKNLSKWTMFTYNLCNKKYSIQKHTVIWYNDSFKDTENKLVGVQIAYIIENF